MKLGLNSTSPGAGSASFDDLRAQLEGGVSRPAVIAIASSTSEDGKEIAARGLAHSLATTGYTTLLINVGLSGRGPAKQSSGLPLDEIVSRISTPSAGSGNLSVLTLSDPALQRTTSQRGVESALAILRRKFEFVVISTEFDASPSFTTSIVATADAVLVTVATGRRAKSDDARLSALLDRIGSRFLGVVAIDRAVIKEAAATFKADTILEGQRGRAALPEREHTRREVVNSPT
jgi:hypothetical protein